MFLISMLLSTTVSLAAPPPKKLYGPVVGKLRAEIRITNSKSLDDVSLLDGAILEMGPAKCTVQAGACFFDSLPPKTHIASVLYDPKVSGVDFRFTGTEEGFLFASKGKSKVVYQFEKIIDPSVQIAEDSNVRYQTDETTIDVSLTAELWIKVVDDREPKPYLRRASEELHGRKIRLGDHTCVVQDNICKFRSVRRGTYKINLVSIPTKEEKSPYRVAAESKEVEIVLDQWTRRPRSKNYSGNLRIVLEKILH